MLYRSDTPEFARKTKLILDDLEKILQVMTHLQQLDVYNSYIKTHHEKMIKQFLEITATRVKILNLRDHDSTYSYILFYRDLGKIL